jgi:hypothetical protein
MVRILLAATLAVLVALPAHAHKLILPGIQTAIAKGAFAASSRSIWNRLDQKEGKYQEIWTIDGEQLNQVMFFGGVPAGEPLLKERNKKLNPLPRVNANMLLPDLPVILERTYRTRYGTTSMEIGLQEPATFAGIEGVHFEYKFIPLEDEVERKGEAFAGFKNGKLYMIAFEAPSLHYFDKSASEFKEIVASLRLNK